MILNHSLTAVCHRPSFSPWQTCTPPPVHGEAEVPYSSGSRLHSAHHAGAAQQGQGAYQGVAGCTVCFTARYFCSHVALQQWVTTVDVSGRCEDKASVLNWMSIFPSLEAKTVSKDTSGQVYIWYIFNTFVRSHLQPDSCAPSVLRTRCKSSWQPPWGDKVIVFQVTGRRMEWAERETRVQRILKYQESWRTVTETCATWEDDTKTSAK